VAIVGHSGTAADLPGHDLTYQAEVGLIDGAMPRSPYADFIGAERAVSETCAALLARELHGRSSYREVSLADAAAYLAEPLRRGLTAKTGRLGGGFPGYAIYPAREGRVAVACLEPHFWQRLKDGLAVDGGRASLEKALLQRTASEWHEWAMDRDIPLARINDEAKH
jgi:crotonobetainyl-CoA:carnitine CoA-transferase CaiB-like acyl-CoA transferase